MEKSIWKKVHIREEDESLYKEVDQFFESLNGSKELEYREGQHTMALDIVDTIRDRQILLIEAQVGIGKSYAYLIPLLTAVKNNSNFQGFIVATSTIALQEQLLKDVHLVAEMLGMDSVDVVLAKGKNNYLCLSRLSEYLKEAGTESYHKILEKILEDGGSDRHDFEEIPESVWRKVNVKNCKLYSCPNYGKCKYVVQRENYSAGKKVIITNQDLLVQHMKRGEDSNIFSPVDMIVIDEAHNFENKLRNAHVEAIDKRRIEGAIYCLYQSVSYDRDDIFPSTDFFEHLNHFFTLLRFSAKRVMATNKLEVEDFSDHQRIKFVYGPKMKAALCNLSSAISRVVIEVKEKNEKSEVDTLDKRSLGVLEGFQKILNDILKGKDAENIYWVDFLDHNGKYIQLMYSPKQMDRIAANIFSREKAGIVLTSATLDANDHYDYYSNSVGLDHIMGKAVLKEYPIFSPYNYEENTILYCPKNLVNPNEEHDLYMDQITEEIKNLITLTKGRSLILFNSKKEMTYVYQRLQQECLEYPIYMQQEGINSQKIKDQFEKNTNSCLLATGTFFEGIDIKGESLSSLIITKLPFPIVDPVIEERASVYHDYFQKVYLPEMLLKLKQGTGRLIRSGEDKGVVSILDSRFLLYNEIYQDRLIDSLPFGEVTFDLNEVQHFVQSKLK